MSNKAPINPAVLRWARETAKFDLETAAPKVSVSVERLVSWEDGSDQPTITQAKKLAKLYRRSFALLFLEEIPKDFSPLKDFRRDGSKELSSASVFIIREIQQRQEWISEFNQENGEEKASFVGRFTINDDTRSVANDILETLNIHPPDYSRTAIREWVDAAERNGICISRTSNIHSHLKLDAEEVQGFTIADPFAPFIFINSQDYDAPQVFTLVHELVHLWIAASGISNSSELTIEPVDGLSGIEYFCNEVAGLALIPDDVLNSIPDNVFDRAEDVYRTARNLGISSRVLLVRSYKANRIDLDIYRSLKNQTDAAFRAFIKQEEEKKARQKADGKTSAPNYYLLTVNRNSRLFTQVVLGEYKEGNLDPAFASSLLNVRINRFSKLEEQLYK